MAVAPKPTLIPRFGDLVAWTQSTFFALGRRAVANGNVYQVTVQGTSSGAGTGPSGNGGAIVDGSVTWAFQAAVSTAWASTTGYTAGDIVTNDGGKLYQALNTATSGNTGGPTGTGGAIADGGMVWAYTGTVLGQQTTPTSRVGDAGAVPGAPGFAQYENWWKAGILPWVYYLRDLGFDSFSYPAYDPAIQFRENWIRYFEITDATPPPIQAWQGSPWYVAGDEIDTGFQVINNVVSSSVGFPNVKIKPGTVGANDDAWIYTGGVTTTLAGGIFHTSQTTTKFAMNWVAAISAVGANNTTWNMGIDDTSLVDFAYLNNLAISTSCQFRKKSTDTHWQAVTADGSSETVTDTGITPSASTFNRFRLEWDRPAGPVVRFYIDGALVATHTTNLPGSVGLRPAFGGTRTAAATSYMLLGPVFVASNIYY